MYISTLIDYKMKLILLMLFTGVATVPIQSNTTTTTTTVAPTTTTTSVIRDSLLGGSCVSNQNCNGLVAHAICVNSKCACASGYTASGSSLCVTIQSRIDRFYFVYFSLSYIRHQ